MQPEPNQNEEPNQVGPFMRLFYAAIKLTSYLKYASIFIAFYAIYGLNQTVGLDTLMSILYSVGILAVVLLSFLVGSFISGKTKFIGFWQKVVMSCFLMIIIALMFSFCLFVYTNKPIFFKRWFPDLASQSVSVKAIDVPIIPAVIPPDSIFIKISDNKLKRQISTRLGIPLSENPRAKFILKFSYPPDLLKHSKELDQEVFEYWPGGKITVSLKGRYTFSIKESIPEITYGSEREVINQLDDSIKSIIKRNLTYVCNTLKPYIK
jgi:hypothetical protein